MRPALSLMLIVLGLAQIGVAVATMRTLDGEMSSRTLRTDRTVEGRFGEVPDPTISTGGARKMTMLGAASALLGGCTTIVGATLLVSFLLEKRSMRSALGTDHTG